MRSGVGRSSRVVAAGLVAAAAIGCGRPSLVPPLPPLPEPVIPYGPPAPPAARDPAVDEVVGALGARVRAHWKPLVAAAGISYPPGELALLGFKRERRLEVWGRDTPAAPWVRIDALPILAASGAGGPKLRQGDLQVPEGLYRLVAFNPRSRFHLSLMIDYPNTDDIAVAAATGRTDLGGDIFIHGGARSIGCLALGDRAIENLFVLVADVGLGHVEVVLAPHDPRGGLGLAPMPGMPFTADLYRRIADHLAAFATGGPPS